MKENNSILDHFISEFSRSMPWTNFIGFFRSAIAVSTLITLLFNDIEILSHKADSIEAVSQFIGISKIGIFYILANDLQTAYYFCIIILLFVISGYLPQISCLLHWWVCFSINTGLLIVDGGDQVSSAITLLLIPVLLTDTRYNHWIVTRRLNNNFFCICIANFSILTIKIQISFIYFHSFISKLNIPEWNDASILHYWFSDPLMGLNSYISPLFYPFFIQNSYVIFLTTWVVLILEFTISLALFFKDTQIKKSILFLGIFFHLFISIIFGIIPFALTMISVLTFYLLNNKNYKLLQNNKLNPSLAKHSVNL